MLDSKYSQDIKKTLKSHFKRENRQDFAIFYATL